MGKSYKKNPFSSTTSEKFNKRKTNRRLRKKEKSILKNFENEEEIIFPNKKEISDVWDFAKDGKYYVPKNSKYYKETIRK